MVLALNPGFGFGHITRVWVSPSLDHELHHHVFCNENFSISFDVCLARQHEKCALEEKEDMPKKRKYISKGARTAVRNSATIYEDILGPLPI